MNDKASLELMDEHGVGYSVRGLVRQMRDNGNTWKQVSPLSRIPPCLAICASFIPGFALYLTSDALSQCSPCQSSAPSVAGITCRTLRALNSKPAGATRLALLSDTLERLWAERLPRRRFAAGGGRRGFCCILKTRGTRTRKSWQHLPV